MREKMSVWTHYFFDINLSQKHQFGGTLCRSSLTQIRLGVTGGGGSGRRHAHAPSPPFPSDVTAGDDNHVRPRLRVDHVRTHAVGKRFNTHRPRLSVQTRARDTPKTDVFRAVLHTTGRVTRRSRARSFRCGVLSRGGVDHGRWNRR